MIIAAITALAIPMINGIRIFDNMYFKAVKRFASMYLLYAILPERSIV